MTDQQECRAIVLADLTTLRIMGPNEIVKPKARKLWIYRTARSTRYLDIYAINISTTDVPEVHNFITKPFANELTRTRIHDFSKYAGYDDTYIPVNIVYGDPEPRVVLEWDELAELYVGIVIRFNDGNCSYGYHRWFSELLQELLDKSRCRGDHCSKNS